MSEQASGGVLALIDELLANVEGARKMPLTNKVMVDQDLILDLLEQLRDELPDELNQAQWLLRDRDKLISQARSEAERILREATARAEELARESVITETARKRAEEMVEQAGQVAREIRVSANEYTDGLLLKTQETVVATLKAIEAARNELRTQAAAARSVDRAAGARLARQSGRGSQAGEGDKEPAEQ